jgi:hypothetical protein
MISHVGKSIEIFFFVNFLLASKAHQIEIKEMLAIRRERDIFVKREQ